MINKNDLVNLNQTLSNTHISWSQLYHLIREKAIMSFKDAETAMKLLDSLLTDIKSAQKISDKMSK